MAAADEAADTRGLVVALDSFSCPSEDGTYPIPVSRGDILHADGNVARRCPSLVAPLGLTTEELNRRRNALYAEARAQADA